MFSLPACWHKIAVVRILPTDYPHTAAFDEVVETVVSAFRELGSEVEIRANSFAETCTNIVFGAHLLGVHAVQPHHRCILYNFEQLNHKLFIKFPHYKKLLNTHWIWDYSKRNLEFLRRWVPHESIHHVPVGYMPCLSRIPSAQDQDIDVLFYGSLNERRRNILEALTQEGLRVHIAFNKYGQERDALIARAKVVLNLHHYESKIFESVRVSYLLANRKAVVAECGEDTEMDPLYRETVLAAPYSGLVRACQELVSDGQKRKLLEEKAFSLFSQHRQDNILVDSLCNHPDPATELVPLRWHQRRVRLFCDQIYNFARLLPRRTTKRVSSLR